MSGRYGRRWRTTPPERRASDPRVDSDTDSIIAGSSHTPDGDTGVVEGQQTDVEEHATTNYVIGGQQAVVDQLAARARELAVRIEIGARVDALPTFTR
ncbi:MAG TPA: hypothetical protein VIL34_15025 [Actinopolymorphaceae bacterium]